MTYFKRMKTTFTSWQTKRSQKWWWSNWIAANQGLVGTIKQIKNFRRNLLTKSCSTFSNSGSRVFKRVIQKRASWNKEKSASMASCQMTTWRWQTILTIRRCSCSEALSWNKKRQNSRWNQQLRPPQHWIPRPTCLSIMRQTKSIMRSQRGNPLKQVMTGGQLIHISAKSWECCQPKIGYTLWIKLMRTWILIT